MHYIPLYLFRYLCYDDGYHLKKFATNPKRANHTQTSIQLASMSIVIDKMHFRGHTDSWCQQNCNPHKFADLEKVGLCT